MDAEVFLQQFGALAQGEGGIRKLRDLILQLAVRGKLVEQDAEDEPAEVLLKKIETERKTLIKQGKIKARAIVASDKGVPHTLPYSWKIVAIDHVVLEIRSGGTPSKGNASFWTTHNGIFWASVKDLKFGEKYISSTQDMITELALHNNKTKLAKAGEFLICTRMGLGKISICACDMAFNQDLKAVSISANIDPSYFHIFFQTLTIKGTGTTVDGIVQEKLLSYPFPLPPLAEQKRIVAKVDELMALCDKLEAEQEAQRTLKTQAVQSTLHHLCEAGTPASFGISLNILERTFGNWFDDLATVKRLRATILQLAVQGKLVPQDPNDEPASVLLKRIEAEKKRLEKESKVKIAKPFAPINTSDQPYIIPENWQWTRFSTLVQHSEAGWSPKCEEFPRISDNWGVLKVSAVSWGKFKPEENKALPAGLEPRPEYEVMSGDMLISRANTAELVAKSVVVEDCPPKLMMSDKIIRFKLTPLVDLRFCNLVNASGTSRRYYADVAGGTSASMKNVSREQILSLAFPLPPLAEQKRIVAKVDELMRLCDQLEAHITDTKALNIYLTDSLLHKMAEVA